MLYLPEQCAHGYQTLEDDTEMHYMASHFYTAARHVECAMMIFRRSMALASDGRLGTGSQLAA